MTVQNLQTIPPSVTGAESTGHTTTRTVGHSTAVTRDASHDGPARFPLCSVISVPANLNVGQYLLRRLYELGVHHIFGIPGDYSLAFCKMIEESPIRWVGTAHELGAGFAADAYARVRGIGAACVTYGVGGLNLANAAGCAMAEKSPVVFISGSPGLKERQPEALLHHIIGPYDTQREVFARLTVAHAVLEDQLTAFREIDRVLEACVRHKQPVYLELPRDRVALRPLYPHEPTASPPTSDQDALGEAVRETVKMLCDARRPMIIAGIEVHRFGLQAELVQLAERANIPMAALLLSKSVVRENHPLYVGVYGAAMGRPEVTAFVEESDLVLMFGAFLADLDTGMFTHRLDDSRCVMASSETVRIRRGRYPGVRLGDFLRELVRRVPAAAGRPLPTASDPIYAPWCPKPGATMTIGRLFQKINSILDDTMVVIADPGEAMFGASDLTIHQGTGFLGNSFYGTLGYAVPASLGVKCAEPHRRPLVLVGDGSFQQTMPELGVAAHLGFNPIVVVLNNDGYTTERLLLEGAFNDIPAWRYHRLPEVFASGQGFHVRTEDELEAAFAAGLANTAGITILDVKLARMDISPALRRLTARLSQRV